VERIIADELSPTAVSNCYWIITRQSISVAEILLCAVIQCNLTKRLAYIGLIGNMHDVENLQLTWFKLQSSPNKPKCRRSVATKRCTCSEEK